MKKDDLKNELVQEITKAILVLNRESNGGYAILEAHAEERARNITTWVGLLLDESLTPVQKWELGVSREVWESVKCSIRSRRTLFQQGMPTMAKKIERMLRDEFPDIPEEIFEL